MHDVPPTHVAWQKISANEGTYITQFAQQMESLGILVAEQHINIDLVDKLLVLLVTTAWEKYKIMIFDSTCERPDPFFANIFQWLAEQIDERIEEKSTQAILCGLMALNEVYQ